MEIKLKNLTKVFSNKEKVETVAVDKLNVTIPSGHLVGLLGPSGCGKSTTLFMIAGLLEPSEGKIFFGDENVTELPPEKRGIGLVFQNYALYPHMTVFENISFPLRNSKSFRLTYPNAKNRRNQIEKIVKETAEVVAIQDLLNRKPGQLSGGQQQRVAIARALAKKPKVLLLDEPLSNLDARLRIQTREEIRRIQQKTGITTIFVTHDQEEAMSITDEIVVMKEGEIQQVGEPQATYNHPDNAFVAKFLGNPPINLFDSEVKDGYLYINNEKALKVTLPDGVIQTGIRPESFRICKENEQGFDVKVDFKSTIGRDILIRFNLNDVYSKALVESDNHINKGDTVKIKLKPNGIHLFEKNGERIEKW
ncbi:MAG: sugar ABC transporter ATP-binding protein [Treponema sp. CETP13]|nr:MAG: sugar ABC transporter ATP-binding protein [Treponema sp. CETP13]